jgi:outer membrane murein-binding lipoprotein Lpp
MHSTLETICNSLDELSNSILAAYSEDKTLNEVWGWNYPPLNRHDLSNLSKNLSDRIRQNDINEIKDDLIPRLEEIPKRIGIFKGNTLTYFFNGHGQTATPAYISLIEWITTSLEPIFGWQVLHDNKALPNQLARRLRSIQSELNEIVPEKDDLKRQIDLIRDATAAAESLPTDMESLKEARAKVNKFSTDSAELYGKIDTYYNDVEKISKEIIDKKDEADKLVAQCEEAYKITTTKGLAASFDQRAKRLSNTMWIWVVGLLLSLVAGGLIGASRFESLIKAIQVANPQWGVIWMDFILSIIGLAAPIWFAWIATKQISQRFRLSEDYAFKASVAKAYEGYRREAARIDEAFEARLFSSALSRLEEAPLRLVDNDYHGSPWHEFFSSPAFQKALDAVPDLKDKFISIAKDGIGKLNGKPKTEEIVE